MQENNKIEDEYILMPCPCPCHRNTGMKHVMACCKNGFIKVRKQQQPAPSSTPQSVEGILDNEHWKFVEEVGLTSIHTKTFPEAYRQQAIRAMQEYANQLVGDKEREITELKRSILSGLKVEGELQSQLLQAQKEVEYWKAFVEFLTGKEISKIQPSMFRRFEEQLKNQTHE